VGGRTPMNLSAHPPVRRTTPLPPNPSEARAIAPASCGALMRGWASAERFIVSCPVNVYCEARVRSIAQSDSGITVSPSELSEAVSPALARYTAEGRGVTVDIHDAGIEVLWTAAAQRAAAAFAAGAVS